MGSAWLHCYWPRVCVLKRWATGHGSSFSKLLSGDMEPTQSLQQTRLSLRPGLQPPYDPYINPPRPRSLCNQHVGSQQCHIHASLLKVGWKK